MRTHTFTLILSGVSEITPDLADTLYEATQGDIEFALRDGVAYLECSRRAPTLGQAVLAVIEEVEAAVGGVRVVRVETAGPRPG